MINYCQAVVLHNKAQAVHIQPTVIDWEVFDTNGEGETVNFQLNSQELLNAADIFPKLSVSNGKLYYDLTEVGVFTPQQEPDYLQLAREVASLTPMQFELALLEHDLLDDIEAFVAHPDTPKRIKIMFARATSFDRMNQDLIQMAEILNLTPELVDIVFGVEVPE